MLNAKPMVKVYDEEGNLKSGPQASTKTLSDIGLILNMSALKHQKS
jgi:hypothetical protein